MPRDKKDRGDERPLIGTPVDLTPLYSSKKMRYRVSARKLKPMPFVEESNVIGDLIHNKFFMPTPSGKADKAPEEQFEADQRRGYYFSGRKLDTVPLSQDMPEWADSSAQNEDRLASLFGAETAKHILAGHSQIPSYLYAHVSANAYLNGESPLIVTPNHQRINIDQRRSGKKIYQEILISEYTIKDFQARENDGLIGYLPGPARIVYTLEKQDDRWGYQFQYVESDNKDIVNMFCGRPLSLDELKRKYCGCKDYVKERAALEKVLTDRDNQYDTLLKEQAVKVLRAANHAFYEKKAPEAAMAAVLRDTANFLKSPTEKNAKIYHKNAGIISKRSWGKILGASMLILAGVALIAASTAAALFSFGALAPVSVLGYTLAASTMISGIAIGTSVAGTAIALGGSTLFAKGVGKSSLRKEMETLAKSAKADPKGKGRVR